MSLTLDGIDDATAALARVLAILTGSMLFKVGFAVAELLDPFGSPLGVLALLSTYLAGLGLVVAGVVDLDFERWGSRLAVLVTAVVFLDLTAALLARSGPRFGTDAMLFARYAVDLLLAGENPYAHTMAPAFDRYPVVEQFVTFRTSGEVVTSLSYPALSFLVYVPQALLGVPNLNLTTIVVFLVVLLVLVHESPGWLALAPYPVLFLDPSLLAFSFGGVFDIVWVLPLLVGMRFWHRGELGPAAAAVGTAYAVKQIAWITGPFFAIWLYESSATWAEFRGKLRTTLSWGLAAFLLPNLPFVLWDPAAWLRGVFTPVAGGAALVQQGKGLVATSVFGVYGLPKSAFTVATLGVLAVLLAGYALYFERVRWAAWIVPAIVLWFNYRSLQSYFVFFVPVAYYAALCQLADRRAPAIQPATPHARAEGAAAGDGSDRDRVTTLGPGTATGSLRSHLGGATRRLPHPSALPRRRKLVVLLVVLVLAVLATAGTAVAGHEASTLDASVTVLDYGDPTDRHRVTRLTVAVENHGDRSIRPAFDVLHSELGTHNYWRVASGPPRLAPGERAAFEIVPRHPAFALPIGGRYVLGVGDRGSQLGTTVVRSVPVTPLDGVRNPRFAHWRTPYGATTPAPADWRIAESDRGVERTLLANASGDPRLTVSGVERTGGPWAMVGLRQRVPFPETLTLTATPGTVLDAPTADPSRFAGLQLADGDRRVWIGFADVPERTVRTRTRGELSYAMVYLPADAGERVTRTVDVGALYERRGWERPPARSLSVDGVPYRGPHVGLLAFAAVYPDTPATAASLRLHAVSTTGPSLTTPEPEPVGAAGLLAAEK